MPFTLNNTPGKYANKRENKTLESRLYWNGLGPNLGTIGSFGIKISREPGSCDLCNGQAMFLEMDIIQVKERLFSKKIMVVST